MRGEGMEQFGYASVTTSVTSVPSYTETYIEGRANHDVVAPNEPRPNFSPAGGLGWRRDADRVMERAGLSRFEGKLVEKAAGKARGAGQGDGRMLIGHGPMGRAGTGKYVPPGESFTLDVTNYAKEVAISASEASARGRAGRRASAVRNVSRMVNLHGTAGHAHQLQRGTNHIPVGDGAEGERPSGRGNVHGSRMCRELTLEPSREQRRSRSPSPEPAGGSRAGSTTGMRERGLAVSQQLASGLESIAQVRRQVMEKATLARKLAVSNPVGGGAGRTLRVLDEDHRRFGAVPEVADVLERSDMSSYGCKGYGSLVGARSPLAPGFMTVHRAPGAQGGYAPVLRPVRKTPVWKTNDMLKSKVMDQRLDVEEIALHHASLL